MKSIFYFRLLVVLLVVSTTSCRDKGEYAYTGVLLDSCGVNPIANAEVFVSAGQTGDRRTTTNANGFFSISGSWNEQGGLMSKPVIPVMTIRDSVNKRLLELDYLPEGEHHLGGITTWTRLQIPFKIDDAAYPCSDCAFNFQVINKSMLVQYGWTNDFPKGTTSGIINTGFTVFINSVTKEINGPVVLYFNRYDSVSVAYPEIDITPFLKLCGLSDTVTIAL
jgi:hypothetical protein